MDNELHVLIARVGHKNENFKKNMDRIKNEEYSQL